MERLVPTLQSMIPVQQTSEKMIPICFCRRMQMRPEYSTPRGSFNGGEADDYPS